MRDIKEINARLKRINKFKSESYEYRKLDYCERINIEAKNEIEIFLSKEVVNYVKERVVNKRNWERSTDGLAKMFDVPPYKYSYYKTFYDPEFDFFHKKYIKIYFLWRIRFGIFL